MTGDCIYHDSQCINISMFVHDFIIEKCACASIRYCVFSESNSVFVLFDLIRYQPLCTLIFVCLYFQGSNNDEIVEAKKQDKLNTNYGFVWKKEKGKKWTSKSYLH